MENGEGRAWGGHGLVAVCHGIGSERGKPLVLAAGWLWRGVH